MRGGLETGGRIDAEIFGEEQSRIVVSLEPARLGELQKLAARHQVSLKELGTVGGERFVIEGMIDLPLRDVAEAWRGGLKQALG